MLKNKKEKATGFFKEFKTFITKGNILSLAIGVVIGAAFGKITASLVADIIMPPIGLLIGGVDFADMKWVLKAANEAEEIAEVAIRFGAFIQTILEFLIIGLSLFLAVRIISRLSSENIKKLIDKRKPSETADEEKAESGTTAPSTAEVTPAEPKKPAVEDLLSDIKEILLKQTPQIPAPPKD